MLFSDLFFYFFFSCARLVSCLFSVFFSLFFKTFKSYLQFFRWSCPYYTTLRLLFSVTVPQTTLRLFFQEPFYPNHTQKHRLSEQIDKMVNRYIFAVAGLAAQLNALPLNINLGAYSPALVVGDGEISFGGRNDVSQLMNVLEGAAVNAAQGAANAPAAAPAAPAAPATPATPQQPPQQAAASVGGATPVTASSADNQINEVSGIF